MRVLVNIDGFYKEYDAYSVEACECNKILLRVKERDECIIVFDVPNHVESFKRMLIHGYGDFTNYRSRYLEIPEVTIDDVKTDVCDREINLYDEEIELDELLFER